MDNEVFRNRTQSHAIAAIGAGTVILIGAVVMNPAFGSEAAPPPGTRMFAAILAVLLGAFTYRLARARVILAPTGVRIINVTSQHTLRWNDVVRFRVGSWLTFTRIGIVDLKGGRSIPLLGMTGPHRVPWNKGVEIEALVAQM